VHLLELDQIIGRDYLVTVHGPLNPIVDPAEALVETDSVLRRLESGRFRPSTPHELSFAITSAVARRQRGLINQMAEKLPGLEKHVMDSRLTNPEELLERMFLIRHELITTRTMAAQCCDVWARMAGLSHLPDETAREYLRDLADQFERVRSIADGESHFLFGVIELYQTKVNTKMTVAMERLAVIAAITLPITAIASIEGMNMIVSVHENLVEFGVVLLLMLVMSIWLLRWARRQGWWGGTPPVSPRGRDRAGSAPSSPPRSTPGRSSGAARPRASGCPLGRCPACSAVARAARPSARC
jgi:magnesium transporter